MKLAWRVFEPSVITTPHVFCHSPRSHPSGPNTLVNMSRFQSTSSAAQIITNSSLESRSPLAQDVAQVLKIVAGSDAKLAHKVLGRRFEVAILLLGLIFRPPKVRVGRNRSGTLEPLQSVLGFGLSVGVEGTLAEVFIRRNTLLSSKLAASIVLRLIYSLLASASDMVCERLTLDSLDRTDGAEATGVLLCGGSGLATADLTEAEPGDTHTQPLNFGV